MILRKIVLETNLLGKKLGNIVKLIFKYYFCTMFFPKKEFKKNPLIGNQTF